MFRVNSIIMKDEREISSLYPSFRDMQSDDCPSFGLGNDPVVFTKCIASDAALICATCQVDVGTGDKSTLNFSVVPQ